MKIMECYSVELFKMSQIQNVHFIIILDFEYLQRYSSYKTKSAFPQCAFKARTMLCTPNDRSFTIKYSRLSRDFFQTTWSKHDNIDNLY